MSTSRWTFSRKLGAAMIGIVILVIGLTAIAVSSLQAVIDAEEVDIAARWSRLSEAQRLDGLLDRKAADLRAYLLTGEAQYPRRVEQLQTEIGTLLETLVADGESQTARAQLAQIEAASQRHHEAVTEVIDLHRRGASAAETRVAFDERVSTRYESLASLVDDYRVEQRVLLDAQRAEVKDSVQTTRSVMFAVGGGVVLLALAIAVLLTRALSRQLGGSVEQVRIASAELQAAATQQASGSRQHASAMSEIATTVNELLVTSRQIADSAQQVASIAGDAANGARTGTRAMDEATAAIESIRAQVEAIVRHMLDLGRRSQQIGGILELINELSEQTNILAINATIEAAGAGESGRRFAAIGEEIRKLADRVSSSTREIRGLIDEVRHAVNASVMATETGAKTVDAGTERFSTLHATFERIERLVATTTDAAREIELSTKQQTSAVEQVNVAIANVAEVTRESEVSSTQTLQTASQLAGLSDELARVVRHQPRALRQAS